MSPRPITCGTQPGYARHLRRKQVPCKPCMDAHTAYARWLRQRPPAPPRELVPCGSPSAWRRHKRRGEQPCDPCVQAHRNEVARYTAMRRGVAS